MEEEIQGIFLPTNTVISKIIILSLLRVEEYCLWLRYVYDPHIILVESISYGVQLVKVGGFASCDPKPVQFVTLETPQPLKLLENALAQLNI